jgi:tryptophan synthase beta chain
MEAVDAFQNLTRLEGILPALESAHALAHIEKIAGSLPADHLMVLCLSGRGDKDMDNLAGLLGDPDHG